MWKEISTFYMALLDVVYRNRLEWENSSTFHTKRVLHNLKQRKPDRVRNTQAQNKHKDALSP